MLFQVETIPALAALLLAMILNIAFGRERPLQRLFNLPTELAGRSVSSLEARYNRPEYTDRMRKIDGLSTMTVLVFVVVLIGLGLEVLFAVLPYGWIGEAFVVATVLLHRWSYDRSRTLLKALTGGQEAARAILTLMANRETERLDLNGIARAGIEVNVKAFAEGIVGPSLWFILLGLPGLFTFRLINVAASTIDYRTNYSACFGLTAIRSNRMLMAPVKWLSAVLILLASLILPGASTRLSWQTLWRQSHDYFDGNFGPVIAATAGALNLQLGGDIHYAVKTVPAKPVGPCESSPSLKGLAQSIRLLSVAATLLALLIAGMVVSALPFPITGL